MLWIILVINLITLAWLIKSQLAKPKLASVNLNEEHDRIEKDFDIVFEELEKIKAKLGIGDD